MHKDDQFVYTVVVEVIAPFGGAEEMVKDLKDKVFPIAPSLS